MVHAVTQTLGVDVTAVDDSATHEVPTSVIGSDGYLYTYVQANGAIAASQTDISVTAAGQASDGGGTYVGPATAIADNQYFWARSAAVASA